MIVQTGTAHFASSSGKPRGSIRWSCAPELAQSRMILPVLGGIFGFYQYDMKHLNLLQIFGWSAGKTKLVIRAAPGFFQQGGNSSSVSPVVMTSSMIPMWLLWIRCLLVSTIPKALRTFFFLSLNEIVDCFSVSRILSTRSKTRSAFRERESVLAISRDWLKPLSVNRCFPRGTAMR